jgi:hypothetical protein
LSPRESKKEEESRSGIFCAGSNEMVSCLPSVSFASRDVNNTGSITESGRKLRNGRRLDFRELVPVPLLFALASFTNGSEKPPPRVGSLMFISRKRLKN